MIRFVCKKCGSDSVGIDAFCDWNYHTQQWEFANFHAESGFCFECSDASELIEIDEEIEKETTACIT